MTTLLHVNASARGAQSRSLHLAELFVDGVVEREPGLVIDRLDLFDGTLPEFGTTAADAKMAVFAGQQQTPEQEQAWADARAVFERLSAADLYVFNVPFWNAGVPYVLKQWIDVVTQPGWSFGFDPDSGYSGLLQGKQAFVVYSSGVYADGLPASFGSDFTKTFFNDWLRFVGVTEIEEVHFGPTVVNADVEGSRREAEARTIAAVDRLIGRAAA